MSFKLTDIHIPWKERRLTCIMVSQQFGQYKGGKGGLMGGLSNVFSLLMDRIRWVGLRTLTDSRALNAGRRLKSRYCFFAGSMGSLVCIKAWRPSCSRRFWPPPSCLWSTRKSPPPPSKSWACTGSWRCEDADVWRQPAGWQRCGNESPSVRLETLPNSPETPASHLDNSWGRPSLIHPYQPTTRPDENGDI